MKARLLLGVIVCLLNSSLALGKEAPKVVAKPTVNPPNTQLENGLNIDAWYGGWEPDYTKTAYEVMLSYRGIDKFNLVAGMGDSKQVYYDRSKLYGGAYYFYEDYSFFRVFLSERTYKYPTAPGAVAPNPDSSSYERVPRLELEASQYVNQDVRAGLSYELSRPNFYHDKDTSITVHKLSGEVVLNTSLPGVRVKGFASLLRDPDPNATVIKGFSNPAMGPTVATSTIVGFRNTSLFGGAVQYAEPKWNLEVKYLQNRDLDNSYDFSFLNKVAYRIDETRTLQFDHVHDRFSNQSNLRGMSANVYMASYYKQVFPNLRYGFGVKHIGVPNIQENTGFFYIQYRTGVVW